MFYLFIAILIFGLIDFQMSPAMGWLGGATVDVQYHSDQGTQALASLRKAVATGQNPIVAGTPSVWQIQYWFLT